MKKSSGLKNLIVSITEYVVSTHNYILISAHCLEVLFHSATSFDNLDYFVPLQ